MTEVQQSNPNSTWLQRVKQHAWTLFREICGEGASLVDAAGASIDIQQTPTGARVVMLFDNAELPTVTPAPMPAQRRTTAGNAKGAQTADAEMLYYTTPNFIGTLTDKERQVIAWLAAHPGSTAREIAVGIGTGANNIGNFLSTRRASSLIKKGAVTAKTADQTRAA
jgi:hypothetical protein